MVMGTDPGSRSDHCDPDHDQCNDAPSQNNRGGVLSDMVLEGTDDQEHEPGNTRRGSAGMDTTDVLN